MAIVEGGIYNITIRQGVPFALTFEVQDPDGNLIPLTGYTAKGEIRERQHHEAPLLAIFTCTVDEVAATVTIELDGLETAQVTKYGFYDVFLVGTAPGDTPLLVEGQVISDPRVTA